MLDDRPFEELARSAGVTTSAMRHRVSRGLRDQFTEGDRAQSRA